MSIPQSSSSTNSPATAVPLGGSTPTTGGVPTVSVKIKRLNGTAISVEASHKVPSSLDILQYLPKEHQKLAREFVYESLEYAIHNTRNVITFVQWQEAIAKTIIMKLATSGTQDATVMKTLATDCYMAMGDELYKLQPIAVLNTNKALATLRQRATKVAKAEAERIIQDGRRSCEGIIAEAQTRMDEANRARIEAQVAGRVSPPTWMLNAALPIKRGPDSDSWFVAASFMFHVLSFEMKWAMPNAMMRRKRWNAVTAPGFRVMFWTRVNNVGGTYIPNGCHIDKLFPVLPHMAWSSACMSPAMAPDTIRTADHLARLSEAITACFTVVDLSSVLVDPSNWTPQIQAFVPPPLWEIIRSLSRGLMEGSAALKELPCTFEDTYSIQSDACTTFATTDAR